MRLFYTILYFLARKEKTFFIIVAVYNLPMHLITNPSDIYFLTGVRPHDPGEILIIRDTRSKKLRKDRVLCDPRTGDCFEKGKFEIIADRSQWKDVFAHEPILFTDPDFLTQSLREKIE